MSGELDPTVQVIEAGALVDIDEVVLKHGVVFIGKGLYPAKLLFETDKEGNLTGYTLEPVPPESDLVKRFFFRNMHEAAKEKKPQILEIGKPRLII